MLSAGKASHYHLSGDAVEHGRVALALDKRHRSIEICVGGAGRLQVRYGKAARRATSSPSRFSLLIQVSNRNLSHDPPRGRCVWLQWMPITANGSSGMTRIWLDLFPVPTQPSPTRASSRSSSSCGTGHELVGPSEKSMPRAARCGLRTWSGGIPVEIPPEDHFGLSLSPTQVSRVCDYIRANLSRDIGLAELADQSGLSPHYFSTLFKHALGVSPHHYVVQERVHEAQQLLATGRMSIAEVAFKLGFSDQSHFSRTFRKMTGTTPKRYQSTC
jgi:AraC-like DNA-binding protein